MQRDKGETAKLMANLLNQFAPMTLEVPMPACYARKFSVRERLMSRVRSLPFGDVSLGLALLLACPPAALAQTFYSFGGGLNVARRVPVGPAGLFQGNTSQGFAAQASVGRQLTGRLGWRLDVFVSRFDLTQPSHFAGVMCAYNPPPGTCCGICPLGTSKGPVDVTGLAASEFVNVLPSAFGLGMYLIGGVETDYLYQHPVAEGAVQLGLSAGAGVTVPVGDRRQAFVEARYHRLLGAPSQLTWLAPVTVGLRF
jgi:hypothetical protein